jgi:hypothetical protein
VAASVTLSLSISIRTPVSKGKGVILPAATAVWATAVANNSPCTVPCDGWKLRQSRIFVHGQCRQREPRAPTREHDLGAVGCDVHRLVRKAAGNVGKQAARHQGLPSSATSRGLPLGPTPRSRSWTGPTPGPVSSSSPARTGTEDVRKTTRTVRRLHRRGHPARL